jgi:hypothetical protein
MPLPGKNAGSVFPTCVKNRLKSLSHILKFNARALSPGIKFYTDRGMGHILFMLALKYTAVAVLLQAQV